MEDAGPKGGKARPIAEALGVSIGRIAQLKALGMPVDSVDEAIQWRERRQNVAQRKPLPGAKPNVPRGTYAHPPAPSSRYPKGDGLDESEESIDEARTRLMSAQADNEELKRAQTERELLNRERIERAVFEAARGLRDQLSSCAGVLGATVAGMTSAAECEAEIRREHRHLLDTFVRELNQKIEAV